MISVVGASTCTYPANDQVDCDGNCADGGVLYQFDISDQFADGMCCNYGEGSYAILVDGTEVATGGDFPERALTHTFCNLQCSIEVIFVQDNYPSEQTLVFVSRWSAGAW